MAVQIWNVHTSKHYVEFHSTKITTTVTNDPDVVEEWISHTERIHHDKLNHLIVGLDVKWKPSEPNTPVSKKPESDTSDSKNSEFDTSDSDDSESDTSDSENPYPESDTSDGENHPAAVVQFCVANRCLVYQIFWSIWSASTRGGIYGFLANPNYTFVGVHVKSYLEKLQQDHTGLGKAAKHVDLAMLAAFWYKDEYFLNRELRDLAYHLLKKTVDEPRVITMSNWGAEHLTEDRIMYACVRASISYEIRKVLNASAYRDHSQYV